MFDKDLPLPELTDSKIYNSYISKESGSIIRTDIIAGSNVSGNGNIVDSRIENSSISSSNDIVNLIVYGKLCQDKKEGFVCESK